jgi:glycosyltransferase involved in cell wall biosynthesis
VATRVGGVSECVENHTNGIIVDSHTSEPLCASLALLAADSRMRELFASASAMKCLEFAIERMVDDTLAVYRNVLVTKHDRLLLK